MTTRADETKLPKWAQGRLEGLRHSLECLQRRMTALEQASAVLDKRDWFTIHGQQPDESFPRKLWWLNHDDPFPCCSLGPGDILLVGRARHE